MTLFACTSGLDCGDDAQVVGLGFGEDEYGMCDLLAGVATGFEFDPCDGVFAQVVFQFDGSVPLRIVQWGAY